MCCCGISGAFLLLLVFFDHFIYLLFVCFDKNFNGYDFVYILNIH